MALGINTNLASLSAQRALNNTQADTNTAMQRLSTGLRINSAKDDAAGLAVASRFTSQISGMQQASRNASDAVSMLQSAEGGLQSITDNLQRIRELAVQAASDSITDTDRGYLNTEVSQLVTEINRVADTTKYNGTTLLDGTYRTSGLTFQVGADNSTNDRMTVTIADFNTIRLGETTTGAAGGASSDGVDTLSVSTQSNAQTAIDIVDRALNDVNSGRATMGAFQSRFESVVSNLNLGAENATAGRSRVQDADFAVESANLAKNQVLQQAGMSVLAQANALPQQVLALLQ
jgi:flagellin